VATLHGEQRVNAFVLSLSKKKEKKDKMVQGEREKSHIHHYCWGLKKKQIWNGIQKKYEAYNQKGTKRGATLLSNLNNNPTNYRKE